MRYCEFVHDYKDIRHECMMTVARKGERGVLDRYTSGPNPQAIVIKDDGNIVITPIYFIQVYHIVEGGESGCEKFFECYYDESLKTNSENEK